MILVYYFFLMLMGLNCFGMDLLNKYSIIDMGSMELQTQNYLVIKSNFKGSVIFKPSDRFLVEFNVSASDINELHAINYSLYDDFDIVTLNVQKERPEEQQDYMKHVGLIVFCVTLISFGISLAYVCWLKRYGLKEDEAQIVIQDSSQAPLLEMSSAQSSLATSAKSKKGNLQQMQTDESCMSSEDDVRDGLTEAHLPKNTPAPPRPPCNKDFLEMEAFNNSYNAETLNSLPGYDQLKIAPDQYLTSFSLGKKKGGQYVQIAPVDRKFETGGETNILPKEGIPDVLCTSREEAEIRSQYISLPYPSQIPSNFDQKDTCSIKKTPVNFQKTTKSFGSPRKNDESKFATKSKDATMKKSKQSPKNQVFVSCNRPTPLDGPFHFSPLSSGTDRSSDSGRMTDEAYGTLGSTVSNNTTSTGSDSSGSVVTVIAAESDNVRRMLSSSNSHFGIKPIISNPAAKDASNTLPFLKKESKPTVRFSSQTSTSSTKLLNTSMLITMGLLMTVCSQSFHHLSSHSEVYLTFHIPSSLPIKTADLYVNKDSHVSVVNLLDSKTMKINVYDIEASEPANEYEDACKEKICEQACDQSTGKCVCKRGYQLNENEECHDVDECQLLDQPCDPHARCINEKGNFSCECLPGYHGDGFHCQSCDQPCPEGFYETQSCNSHKFTKQTCQKCSERCEDGFYISRNCTRNSDIKCTQCRTECSYMDYELSPCVGHQDRLCKEIRSLPVPQTSNNMLIENRKEVNTVSSYRLQYEGIEVDKRVFLSRPTGYGVQIKLKEVNLAPLYQAVDHQFSNDNSDLKSKLLTEYCPYPIPEKYNLTLKMHEGITTKAAHHTCDFEKEEKKKKKKRSSLLYSIPDALDDLDVCRGDSGYFADPDSPCKTYMMSGRMPQLNKKKSSTVCVKASRMTDFFDVSHKFDDMSTTFLDTNITCANRRTSCDDCLRNCAKKMVAHRGSHSCNVTAEDADNGESPRLQYCYSCCNKRECSEPCDVYYDNSCPQIRCITGNLAEVSLEPIFSSDSHAYSCHIEPVPDYVIYHLEITIIKGNSKVSNKVFQAKRLFNESHKHPFEQEDYHEFLKVSFGSFMDKQPNILQGSVAPLRSAVGFYKAHGENLMDLGVTRGRSIFVKPEQPFAVNTMSWKKENCDSDVLSKLVKNTGGSFIETPNIYVKRLSGFKWVLVNKTQQNVPFIKFTIPAEASILATAFGTTTVKDDDTLKANLLRMERFWELVIEGEATSCPGSFSIDVRDPAHPHSRMFDLDAGISCPPTFSLSFAIPVDTPDLYNKTYLVNIKDAHRTIKMTVYRPYYKPLQHASDFFSANQSQDEKLRIENFKLDEITLMSSPVLVLCVLAASLAFILLVGIITETEDLNEEKLNEGDKMKGSHYCFIVFYVSFKTLYSVLVTFSFLVIVIKQYNQDSMITLGNYKQLVTTANDIQKQDISSMQEYVREEVSRQNAIANQTKTSCLSKLTDLQDQLEQIKEFMKVVGPNHTAIQDMAMLYTKKVVADLTKVVTKFKKEFSQYANKALEKLKRSIVQTSSAIESSKWMDGPRIIYEAVKAKRSKAGLETKPFLQWAGIKQEVDRLVADMSLKEFPLPNLTEFINTETLSPVYKPLKLPKSSEVVLPQNQWYYQFEKKPEEELQKDTTIQEDNLSSSYLSFSTFQIILLVIDLVWFVHRMAGTVVTVRQIVYGCPIYISCNIFHKNDKEDGVNYQQGGSSDDTLSKQSKLLTCFYRLRDINFKIMSTDFIPKLVAAMTAGCVLYISMAASHQLISPKSLSKIGYFDAMLGPLEASYSLAATTVKLNAHKINSFELPLHEQLINTRYKRYQLLLDMYEEVLASSAAIRDSEHCMWKRLLNPNEECECSEVQMERLKFEGCPLPRVVPMPYLHFKRTDMEEKKNFLSIQTLPYVEAVRKIAANTGLSIAVFVLVISIIDLLNNIVWIYFKRFNLLKILPLFEVESMPFIEEPKE